MKIAIDYDDTITLNKEGWAKTINFLQNTLKADVRIVTFRCKGLPGKSNPDIDNFVSKYGLDIQVVYTDGHQKAHTCTEIGWNPDVWIDDNPSTIASYSDMKGMVKGCEASKDTGPKGVSAGSPTSDWEDILKSFPKYNPKIQPFYIQTDDDKISLSPVYTPRLGGHSHPTLGMMGRIDRYQTGGAGSIPDLGGAGVVTLTNPKLW